MDGKCLYAVLLKTLMKHPLKSRSGNTATVRLLFPEVSCFIIEKIMWTLPSHLPTQQKKGTLKNMSISGGCLHFFKASGTESQTLILKLPRAMGFHAASAPGVSQPQPPGSLSHQRICSKSQLPLNLCWWGTLQKTTDSSPATVEEHLNTILLNKMWD